jgi:hypothetical protein
MCYFITVGTNEPGAEVLRRRLSDTFGASPTSNVSILKLLPPNERTFNLGGMCSCHLFSKAHAEPLDTHKLRSKYKTRGWSESKIERAISGKLSAQRESFKGLRPDLREQLCHIVSELGRLSVVVHFYSDDVESEVVRIARKVVVDCARLMKDEEAVAEDTLVEIVA